MNNLDNIRHNLLKGNNNKLEKKIVLPFSLNKNNLNYNDELCNNNDTLSS
jgi:hypothetical protein